MKFFNSQGRLLLDFYLAIPGERVGYEEYTMYDIYYGNIYPVISGASFCSIQEISNDEPDKVLVVL